MSIPSKQHSTEVNLITSKVIYIFAWTVTCFSLGTVFSGNYELKSMLTGGFLFAFCIWLSLISVRGNEIQQAGGEMSKPSKSPSLKDTISTEKIIHIVLWSIIFILLGALYTGGIYLIPLLAFAILFVISISIYINTAGGNAVQVAKRDNRDVSARLDKLEKLLYTIIENNSLTVEEPTAPPPRHQNK